VIQVQDRRHRENAADLAAGCRLGEPADEQELDLGREQEVHEEAVHGHEASDTPHTRCRYFGWQDVARCDIIDDDVRQFRFFHDDAEPARAGAAGVEETRTDLQCSEGQRRILLS